MPVVVEHLEAMMDAWAQPQEAREEQAQPVFAASVVAAAAVQAYSQSAFYLRRSRYQLTSQAGHRQKSYLVATAVLVVEKMALLCPC